MNVKSLLTAVLLTFPPALFAGTSTRNVEFIQEFQPAADDLIELWIPAPLENTDYQRLISREISGNATIVRLVTENENPAPHVYVRWEKVTNPVLKIVNLLSINDRSISGETYSDKAAQEIAKTFLAPTRHVQTDGIVKATAEKITKGIRDPDMKARAVYDWIVANTARDPGVRGCGLGDVKSMLEAGNYKGKCADLNSMFVGLTRAAGVPAREVFGQRVTASQFSPSLGKEGDNTKAQHCRAEFFSSKTKTWVPVDPADVRKYILEEKLTADDPKVKALAEKFFGYWEGSWIGFNFARDFQLKGYSQETVNYFMYPLLSNTKKNRPDGVDPAEVKYVFTSKVLQSH